MKRIVVFLLLILLASPIYAGDTKPEDYTCPDGVGAGNKPSLPIVPFEDLKITCPVAGISATESCSVAAGEGPYSWALSCGTGKIDKDTGVILDIGDCCNGTVTVTGKSGIPVVTQVRAARGKWVFKYQESSSSAPDCRFFSYQSSCTVIDGDTKRVGLVQGYYAVVEGGCDSLPQILCNGKLSGAVYVSVYEWECPIVF